MIEIDDVALEAMTAGNREGARWRSEALQETVLQPTTPAMP